MKLTITILLFIISFCFADNSDDSPSLHRIISKEAVDEIKRKATSWVPLDPENNPLRKYTDDQLRRRLGVPLEEYEKRIKEIMKSRSRTTDEKPQLLRNSPNVKEPEKTRGVNIPNEFNWFTDAGAGLENCRPPILDQGACGSCYAMAAATVFSIRKCFNEHKKSGSANIVEYSPQDLLSCNMHTHQCDGGIIDLGFKYIEDFGLVTTECQPYSDIDNSGPNASKCNPDRCTGSGGTFSKSYCKRGSSVILTEENSIKYEVLNWGPVAAPMIVYPDFYNYGGGLYIPTTEVNGSGHAVVLVGWGYDTTYNKKYWIMMNSWGTLWGENGYFKIAIDDSASLPAIYVTYCIPEV